MEDAKLPDPGQTGAGELMTRFCAGDREAFTLIYRVQSPAVYRFALHMTGDSTKAAEITQDVFVWLIHHPGNFDPVRGELGAFLIGVTRKFLLRQQQYDRKWIPLSEAGEDFRARSIASHAPSGVNESQVVRLREAISSLPARYREVVLVCDIEGHTYEAAAAALECAIGTVRSRLHRARQLLGRKLQPKKEIQRCGV